MVSTDPYAGMRRLGTRDGYVYWLDPSDSYVYQQKPDGTPNGWICSLSVWERWGWKLDA